MMYQVVAPLSGVREAYGSNLAANTNYHCTNEVEHWYAKHN